MKPLLVMSRCHEYTGPDFVPENEYYAKARDRDEAMGFNKNREEALKFHKKTKAALRKAERKSFIPEKDGYYKPVNWSVEERKALAHLRDEPGSHSSHHSPLSGLALVHGMYGDR